MRRFFFHVGAHRTATTYVQRMLKGGAERMREKGVRFERMPQDVSAKINAINAVSSGFDVRVKAASEAFCAHFGDMDDNVLVSWEGMLGGDPFAKGELYGARAPFLDIIQSISDTIGCTLHAAYSFRRQDELISSWYAQKVKTGYHKPPEEYLETIDFEKLDWNSPVNDLKSVSTTLALVPYELLAKNPGRFLTKLLTGTGLEADDFDVGIPRQNPSYNREALDIALFANQNFPMGKETRYAFRALLLRNMGDGPPARILNSLQKRYLVERYAEDNLALLKPLGLGEEIAEIYASADLES